ncbi:MAG: hypothetical protein PHT39_09695 [Sphaerochaetaceae bacterium]|jgi:hypothetical protein|nr:hypothetical protein [Sphaerochaetaceae bacterium]
MQQRKHQPLKPETFVFLALFLAFFIILGIKMGVANLFSTMMNTAFALLRDTALYIAAVAIIMSALAGVLSEFGVIGLLDRLLSPLMGPLFGMPGACSIGVVMTYLSDNPSILAFADNKEFRRYFKKYQIPALTNIGTGFGMGAIITTSVLGFFTINGQSYAKAALVGNLGAIIGCIVSTRLMLHYTKKLYGTEEYCDSEDIESEKTDENGKPKSASIRFFTSLLDGGAAGVKLGLGVAPGIIIICTIVMMLSKGPGAGGVYTGAAYEGVPLLPWIGEKLWFILKPLFGFSSPEAIAVPITALGSAAAGIALIPQMLMRGIASQRDIAVFTAMSMCFSGYLSTHVAMMDTLKCPSLTGKAIGCHTIGGIIAGVSANWLFRLFSL